MWTSLMDVGLAVVKRQMSLREEVEARKKNKKISRWTLVPEYPGTIAKMMRRGALFFLEQQQGVWTKSKQRFVLGQVPKFKQISNFDLSKLDIQSCKHGML